MPQRAGNHFGVHTPQGVEQKRRVAGELNALGKTAFQVVRDEGVFLCKEAEVVLEYVWHRLVGVNG